MSEISKDKPRGRRRAVRSVGPPVDGVPGESTTPAASAAAVSVASVRTSDAGESVATVRSVVAETSEAASSAIPAAAADADSESTEGLVYLGKSDETTNVLDAADDAESVEAEKSKSSRLRILAAVACALVAVAAVAGAGWSVLTMKSVDDRDARRTEYTQTARQAVLNLTTIRADSAKEDIDRILSVASGQFKTEFDGRVDPFLKIVQDAKVVSNGEIIEAAVESDDKNSAKILVAAKQTLTNAGQAEPQTRFYRFRVTVTHTGSGLTASNVEFVG